MKKAIGSILCVVAILLILAQILGLQPDTAGHKIQHWALVGVLLAIGVPLSRAGTPKSPPSATAFPHVAAKVSWVTGVFVILFLMVTGHIGGRLIVELIALLLMVSGLILGLTALLGIRQHGLQRLLAPALAGIMVNGLLVFLFISNFFAARARARVELSPAVSPSVPATSKIARAETSEAVTRLCQHIVQQQRKIIVDTNRTEIIWSDGAMLEVGTTFPASLQSLISQPTDYREIRPYVVRLGAGNDSEWREASIAPSAQGARYARIKSHDGAITALAEPLYIEYLQQRYPKASIRVKGALEPIVFVVDGQIRASVMPIKL